MRLFLALALLATPALAQTAPPASPRERLIAADANKDGKWSKEEWLAAGRREMGFAMIDADKDGFVTQVFVGGSRAATQYAVKLDLGPTLVLRESEVRFL